MKASHKLRAMGDVSSIIASAPSMSAAAKQLGVNRSTLHRWIKAKKVAPPAKSVRRQRPQASLPIGSPKGWARSIRTAYELRRTTGGECPRLRTQSPRARVAPIFRSATPRLPGGDAK